MAKKVQSMKPTRAIAYCHLVDKNGKFQKDIVLRKPHPNDLMHPAVAVVNVLKRWAMADSNQCLREAENRQIPVLSATVDNSSNPRTITIQGKTFELDTTSGERCLAKGTNNKRNDENYWILNPGASGSDRLVFTCERRKGTECVGRINSLCQQHMNPAIDGMVIK